MDNKLKQATAKGKSVAQNNKPIELRFGKTVAQCNTNSKCNQTQTNKNNHNKKSSN